MFISVLTTAGHLHLSSAKLIQSLLFLLTTLMPILILSSELRLGLPSGFVSSSFRIKNLCAFLFSPIRTTHRPSSSRPPFYSLLWSTDYTDYHYAIIHHTNSSYYSSLHNFVFHGSTALFGLGILCEFPGPYAAPHTR